MIVAGKTGAQYVMHRLLDPFGSCRIAVDHKLNGVIKRDSLFILQLVGGVHLARQSVGGSVDPLSHGYGDVLNSHGHIGSADSINLAQSCIVW